MEESMKRQERRMIKKQVKKIFSSGVIQSPVASSDDESFGDMIMDTSDNSFNEIDGMSDIQACENSFSENDYSSGGEEDFSYDEDLTFKEDLTAWINHYRPSREAINDLLKILLKRGLSVPKDARTLLKSPREVNVVSKCGGTYFYLGIKASILEALQHINQCEDDLFLDINIDGVPLTKSSNSQLWPILGSINNSDFVFVIAVFHSFSKPSCVNDYLNDFITEAKQLINDGVYYNDMCYSFSIRSFICDSPARSFLKCIIGHAGYNSCERCCIHGTRVQNRTVFNDCTYEEDRRDGERFQKGDYLGDHQREISPLVDLRINCVRQFPLDYMHLVLLGVVKRILIFLTKGPYMHLVLLGVVKRILIFLTKGPPYSKLSHQLQLLISERMLSHNGLMPSEFNRQPRSLSELAYWKSTEYRQFLLYHGPIVLKGIVENDVYEHFLCLHVAITLLLKKNVEKSQLLFATDLLQWFVKNAVHVYGPTFTVYNVHGLSHLGDDVLNFGADLNQISAFKFENFMQKMKKCVRSSKNPVAQVVKRTEEVKSCNKLKTNDKTMKIKTTGKDSIFMNEQGDICIVENINGTSVTCSVISKRYLESFYLSPIDSKLLGIVYIRDFKNIQLKTKILRKKDLQHKIITLPYKNGFVYFSLLHSFNDNRY